MEMTVDIRQPAFWLNAVEGTTRIGLTDLNSLKEELRVAKELSVAGQVVTFDANDGVAPFVIENVWNLTKFTKAIYNTLLFVKLKPENPNSEPVFFNLASCW